MKKIKVYILGLFMLYSGIASAQFITTWKTDNNGSSNSDQITIPTFGTETYNYTVDWGDGNSDTGVTGDITHTYAIAGTYTVSITGTFPRIYFDAGGFFGSNTDYEKILTVEQWGNISWSSMADAFSGCINLRINAADAPDLSGVTNLSYMFRECENLNDDISSWNVSTITNMTGVFYDAILFNQPLNSWDVSNVTTMQELFRDAAAFNQPLNNWNVGSVINMNRLFSFASSFNQNIGSWNVSNVTDMSSMFGGAFAFNQDISYKPGGGNFGGDAWNTANVSNMNQMFSVAYAFNQDIGNWNTSNVTNIRSMFSGAAAFNYSISGWNISGVANLSNLFRNATAFNQDLSAWNAAMGGITNLNSMFNGATSFNQDISGWDVSNVTDMGNMFSNTPFNANISGWNVSSVQNFNGMFENNMSFNQPIGAWSVANATDMRNMFRGAISFNQYIAEWDITSVNSMVNMFNGATAFDQNLGNWDVSNVTNFSNMLNYSGLSIENYDNLLIGWSVLTLQPNKNLGARGLFYCRGGSAQTIMAANGWTFTDEGEGCITVFKGNDTTGPEIFNAQPEIIDFGSINQGGTKSLNFTIENKLTVDITNFNVAISANTGGAFSLTNIPPTIIAAGSPLTISIDFFGLTTNSFSETVTFSYNPVVGLSSTFSFDITGEVTLNPEPEIAVFEGNTINGTPIIDGVSTVFLDIQPRGTNATSQFTITNKGSDNLLVSSLSVTGTAFSLNPTTSLTIPVDGTQIINVTLDGTVAGSFSETVTIDSDDTDEPTFSFTLEGVIEGPEINVFDGTDIYSDPQIFAGQGTVIDFGSDLIGNDINRQIAISNTGPVDLIISDIIVGGVFNAIPLSTYPFVIPKMVDGIPGETIVDITLSGVAAGDFNEVITILHDDDLIPDFDFFLIGSIIDPDSPKVYWSDISQINRSSLDGTAFEQYHTEPSYNPKGIEVDTLNKVVYWSNNWGQIRKGEISPTGLVNVVDFMNDGIDVSRMMAGLALDVVGDNIYWISVYDGTIKTAKLSEPDPANVSTTDIVSGLSNPVGIAVDPTGNFIYYTNNELNGVGDNIASLHKVNIDGTNDVVLVTETLSGQLFTYNDVVIDVASNNIYWTASNDDIFSPNGNIYVGDLANVSGTISPITVANNAPYGIDLDTKNGRIYWTDYYGYMNSPPTTINSANLDGTGKNVLQSDFPNLDSPLFITLDISQASAGCQDPPTADAGNDQSVCSSDVVTLTGAAVGGASASTWTTSGDGIFMNGNSANATYTPGTNDNSSGSVTLTFTTSAANCTDASDQMVVTIALPISATDQFATANIGEPITINVLNGSTINTGDAITTTLISQPQKGSVAINNDGTIEYTALTGNLGTDSFDFQIENQCNQTATATIDVTIPNTAPSFNDGTASAIPGAPVIINITDLITDLNGNIDLSSIEIIQQPGSGAPAMLDVSANLVVDYTGMIFFGTDEVVIRVCDTGGACSEASIFITVEALPIEAYNAVSPNGDGRHDFLEFRYIEAYPENEVKVFNRWGDVVFTIESYDNVDNIFTGSSNTGGANELPTGTYYYTVTLKVPSGEVQTVNGYFELRR